MAQGKVPDNNLGLNAFPTEEAPGASLFVKAVVAVEVVPVRRDPLEAPPHPPLELLDLRRPRPKTPTGVTSRCARWTRLPSR